MKIDIDTDTRQVRKLDGGYVSGAGKRICDHCGSKLSCPMSSMGILCNAYLPALPFVGDVGFELGKQANTMRVGRAWTQRLSEGQTVALYDTKLKAIFGYATVMATYCGPIVSMLKTHARHNHIMLTTPPSKAPAELGAWMRKNYGPRIIHDQTTLTAIYLQRLSEPAAAPDFKGLEAPGPGEGGAASSGQARSE